MTDRYEWVETQKANGYDITVACETAGVSRQGFYDWQARRASGPTAAEIAEADLVAEIKQIHADSDGTYGEPRVSLELATQGQLVNHKRVQRLMKLHGIVGVAEPGRCRTTIPAETSPKVPDLVKRRFKPGVPDRVWVSDITYIRTPVGWLYLCVIIDLGSRRVIGYAMANHMRTELVISALAMAIAARNGQVKGIVFHSDRGSQYMSNEFGNYLTKHRMRRSAGRTGTCLDNAVAESFFATLKRELVHRWCHQHRFTTHRRARRTITEWIARYNQRRRHSTLAGITPNEWENQYRQQQATKAA